MKNRSRMRPLLLLLLAGFVGLFAISVYQTISIRGQTEQEQAAFELLAERIAGYTHETAAAERSADTADERNSETQPDEAIPTPPQPLEQYQSLYAQNADFFGWLRIDGTRINYPVMYTPAEPEFYLRRAFDGTSSHSGTPFLDGGCDPDGSYYLIYGHHMTGGTIFGALTQYADQSFAREHPIICLDTRYEQREYEVLAAFYSRVCDEGTPGVFRYYAYRELSTPEMFSAFLQGVRTAALYDTDVQAVYGDELLTLSTCNYHTDEGRFAVVARRCK